MNRRSFLGLLGGAVIAALPAPALTFPNKPVTPTLLVQGRGFVPIRYHVRATVLNELWLGRIESAHGFVRYA